MPSNTSSIFTDFSFALTLSACDPGWANTVTVVVVIAVDIAGRRNNGIATHNPSCYLFLSFVLHEIVMYFISLTICDHDSIPPELIIPNSYESSIKYINSSQ